MTTIEEKAQAYAWSIQKGYFPNQCIPNDVIADEARIAYIQCYKDIISQPLAERLTEEEKSKMRNMFNEALETAPCNEVGLFRVGILFTLRSIFGYDFFKDEGK